MRILWVHNFDVPIVSSGVFMYVLLEQMRSMGVDITLHSTGSLRGPRRIISAAHRVRAVSRDYDLVHAQYGSACGFVTSFARTPRLLTLRGTDLFGLTTGTLWHRLHGLICRCLTRISLRSYDNVIVMSDRMRNDLKQAYDLHAEVTVLPSGVDLKQFLPVDRMEARRQLGEAGNSAPWVLFSSLQGTTMPLKRAPLAFASVEALREHCPDVQVKLLTGQTHDKVPLWINACNVVLLTSTEEGWPNIIKEALACNVPFVSTDVSDLAGIAAEEPSCFVVDATPEALARGLLTALQYDGEANLRRHVKSMEVGTIGQQLWDIYQRICGNGNLSEGCEALK